jgi:hypothetical protein
MVPHVQLSTMSLAVSEIKIKFSLHLQPSFSGLTTKQAVDPLPVYRDFPV